MTDATSLRWQLDAAKDCWFKVVETGGADGPVLASVTVAELSAFERSQRVGSADSLRGVGGQERLDRALLARQKAELVACDGALAMLRVTKPAPEGIECVITGVSEPGQES